MRFFLLAAGWNWGRVNFANINRYDNNVKLRAKAGSLFTYRIVFLSEDISSTSVFMESQLCSDKVCIYYFITLYNSSICNSILFITVTGCFKIIDTNIYLYIQSTLACGKISRSSGHFEKVVFN